MSASVGLVYAIALEQNFQAFNVPMKHGIFMEFSGGS